MPAKRIRVKHIGPGHHSTISERAFNPEAHVLLKSPAVTKWGTDVPPKYHTSLGGTPAEKKDEEPQS
jgi:hypothetical protein